METFYEVAIQSPNKRGRFVTSEELSDIIVNNGRENAVYKSVFLYHSDTREDLIKKRSYSTVPRSAYWIPVDIDKGSNTHDYTIRKACSAYTRLLDYGVSPDNMVIWFSGTGYHIDIHSGCFQLEANPEYAYMIKKTMMKLLPDIDPMIYTMTSIIRTPLSLNAKSNLYKVNITREELFSYNFEHIHSVAANYEEVVKRYDQLVDQIENEDIYGDGELESEVEHYVPANPQYGKVSEPDKTASCIFHMMEQGPQEGSRNKTIMVMAAYLRRCGIPSGSAKDLLLGWNNKSLEEKEVISKVEYVYNKGYQFSCDHTLLQEHCKTYCKHFKKKDLTIDIRSYDDTFAQLEYRLSSDFSGKILDIGQMFGLPNIEPIYPGELVTVFGPTGMNKTTLVQNIICGYDMLDNKIRPELQIPTLFLSLELSDWTMLRRNMQIVLDMDKYEVNRKIVSDKSIKNKAKVLLDHIKLITVPPNVAQIESLIKEYQPKVVVIDYIDLIEGEGFNEHDTIKKICHKLSSLAVNLDVIIIQVSQIGRQYAREEILDLYAGKGSGSIENSSRKVIGISGRQGEPYRHVECYKSQEGDLFSVELQLTPSMRLMRIVEPKE